jgi:hypothetical protein
MVERSCGVDTYHCAIAMIYSTTMTLMLRPEVWQQMYAASARGHTSPSDPTLMPRWLFMLTGGLVCWRAMDDMAWVV